MGPNAAIGKAFDMAKQAIAKGGKPTAVKVKVKMESPKMKAVRKKAKQMSNSDKFGVTR